MQKSYLLIALCCAWLCLPITARGQVKIGEGILPETGAVLDMKKITPAGYLGGLLLPHVNITDLGFIPAAFTDADKMAGYNAADGVDTNTELAGLIVYNTNIAAAGVYMWDGNNWIQVVSTVNPSGLPDDGTTAALSGVTCYDVKMTECDGVFDGRVQHDFATINAVAYTFTSTQAVNNLRFEYVNNHAAIPVITSLAGAVSADLAVNGTRTVTVNFYSTLNDDAAGLSGTLAPTATLYAVYERGSITYKKELTITIQDCSCCGAKIAANTWLTFMCHNLGADKTRDPFTPHADIHGAKYKFGAKNPTLTMPQDQNSAWYASVPNWNNTSVYSYQTGSADWIAANDPCTLEPGNWVLPTQAQWAAVVNNNVVSRTPSTTWSASSPANTGNANFNAGLYVGDNLFLPAAGWRSYENGDLNNRGYYGFYWSKSKADSSNVHSLLFVSSGTPNAVNYSHRAFGFSVRCVANTTP